MGLIHYPRTHTITPPYGASINWSHPLAQGLFYAIAPRGSLRERDLVNGTFTAPRSSATLVQATSRFGVGWRNTGATTQGIDTQLTGGWAKGQTYFSYVAFVKVIAIPSSARIHFAHEVASGGTNGRCTCTVSDNVDGATGTKWSVTVRSGASADPAAQLNAGSGGTTVISGQEYVVGYTFNSADDEYKLYVNGILEASSTTPNTSIENTDSGTTPVFLATAAGTSPTNGILSGFFFWRGRVLTASEMAQINRTPWCLMEPPRRKLVFYPSLQYASPNSDVSAGNWTTAPLYDKIDENLPSDSDYISSGYNPSADTCEFRLSNIEEPVDKSLTRIRFRTSKTGPSTKTLTISLYQGSTLIKEEVLSSLSNDTFQEGVISLNSTETASITNWSDLRIRLSASTLA